MRRKRPWQPAITHDQAQQARGGTAAEAGPLLQDNRRWFDEASGRWLPLAEERHTLEIELEDAGGTSPLASLATTLGSQFGNAYYRFVGRAHSADPRWPTDSVVGPTFPAPRAFLADPPPRPQWAEGMTEALDELRDELVAQGWQPVGRGAPPWSFTYARPRLDLERPASRGTPVRRP